MNAGPDVERLISDWLTEEAPDRAPDRILASTRQAIDHTSQRRFAAAWRDTMTISFARLAVVAAVFALAVVGAGLLGRASANVGINPTPVPSLQAPATHPSSASPEASASPTLAEYRTARDAICTSYVQQSQPINAAIAGVEDPKLTPAQRLPHIQALDQFVALGQAMISDLRDLDVPPDLTAEHAANIARYEDTLAVIAKEAELFRKGDLAGAAAVDQATAPISGLIGDYERKYGLADCL
jgi:hypothetical protein